MRLFVLGLIAAAVSAGAVAGASHAAGQADKATVAIDEIAIPAGYRAWPLISVAHEEGTLNDLRAILGNDVAVAAARDGKPPYPDGTILARLAWSYHPLEESEQAFGHPQSHVAGIPKNGVQFMIKDSRRYAATGGWGFAQFDDGKSAGAAVANTCFSCHSVVKARDYVFNRYAP